MADTKDKLEVIREAINSASLVDGITYFFPEPEYIDPIKAIYTHEIITDRVITDTIDNILWNNFYRSLDADIRNVIPNDTLVGDVSEFDSTQAVVEVDKVLSSLPRGYKFVFPMPKINSHLQKKFCRNIELLTVTEDLFHIHPHLKYKRNQLSMAPDEEMDVKLSDLLLIVKSQGFVSKYGLIKKYGNDPLYLFKIIMAYFEIKDVLVRKSVRLRDKSIGPYKYGISDNEDKAWVIVLSESSEDYEHIISRKFVDLSKNMNLLDETIDELSLLIDGPEDNFSEKSEANDMGTRIMNSLFWYYEVSKTKHFHLKVIFLTSGFDSFLPKATRDQKETKANYISSLVASDLYEHKSNNDCILKLYTLRNDIVHGELRIDSTTNRDAYSESELMRRISQSSKILEQLIRNRMAIYLKSLQIN